MIKVESLDKYFNKGKNTEIHVINNTSLSLPSTGLISFVGNSGSGKTTLLNVLGGLDKSNGIIEYDEVSFDGYQMNKIDKYRKNNIGYIYQNYNLLPNLTVYDNLKVSLKIIDVTDMEEVQKRIEYTLKAVGMYKYRKKEAYALSGGQQQRVAIARALLKNAKIIIADEPTGNLDSRNTIEVMNILKKISETSLVLLVTHDLKMASSFSDKIYEVKDGVLNSDASLNINDLDNSSFENVIYLKDLNEQSVSSNVGTIKIYSDSVLDLGLVIVKKDGRIFIKSNNNVQFSKDENIEFLESKKEDVKNDVKDISYDTSFFLDKKEKTSLKGFMSKLKEVFKGAFNAPKKIKALYFVLFFIGIVLSLSVISFINASSVDTSAVKISDNYYNLRAKEYISRENVPIEEMYKKELVDEIISPYKATLYMSKQVSYFENKEINIEYYILPFNEEDCNIIYGNAPKEIDGDSRLLSEVVINIKDVDEIIKECSLDISYEEFIGIDIQLNGYIFKISGITDSGQNCGFITMDDFKFLTFSSVLKNYSYFRYYKYEIVNNEPLYEVVRGRDVNQDSSDLEILIYDLPEYEELGYPQYVYIGKYDFKVVGTFKYPYYISNTYIANFKGVMFTHKSDGMASLSLNEYRIIDGRDVENDNEVIANIYSGKNIGDEYEGKTIVGLYTGSTLAYDYWYLGTLNEASFSHSKNENKKLIFKVSNFDEASKVSSIYAYELLSIKDNQIKAIQIEEDKLSSFIFEIIFIVLFVVSLIFIYLIMRSKMISEIYSIGVYRSLGAPKKYILKEFFLNVTTISLLTSMIGYIFTSILYTLVTNKVNHMFDKMVLFRNPVYLILGGLILFISLIIFGMISIYSLLKKTPSEIMTKYDI